MHFYLQMELNMDSTLQTKTKPNTAMLKWYTDSDLFSLIGEGYNDCLILTDSLHFLSYYDDDQLQDNVEFEWTADSMIVGDPDADWERVRRDTEHWLHCHGYDVKVVAAAHYFRGEGQYYISGDLTTTHELTPTMAAERKALDELIEEKDGLSYDDLYIYDEATNSLIKG